MEKNKEQLLQIAEEIAKCKKCDLYKRATNPVPGEGRFDAQVVFVGEAPGYWEDKEGRPFVGQAGQLLDKLLGIIGLKRDQVFITNVLHHRPAGNRDPLPLEVEACKGYMEGQIEAIAPKVVATLGRFAMNIFLPAEQISKIHGRMIKIEGEDFIIFPLYHPAAALRSPAVMQALEKDLAKLKKLLKMENERWKVEEGNWNTEKREEREAEQMELW